MSQAFTLQGLSLALCSVALCAGLPGVAAQPHGAAGAETRPAAQAASDRPVEHATGAPTPTAPVAGEAAPWGPVLVPQARATELRARASGHRYRILVSVPETPPPAQGYPVLYVLDGNASFPMAAFVARTVERRQQVTGQTPPVVVGLGYPGEQDFDYAARRRDYTVRGGSTRSQAGTVSTVSPASEDASAPLTEGGAEAFLDFIEQDLKPLLQQRYRLDTGRQALFGHSFGGLLVLHALFTRPQQFSVFLASSPSIWWQERAVLQSLPAQVPDGAGYRPAVQISVGALEDRLPPGQHSPQAQALWASRPMVSEARALAAELQARPDWRGRVHYHELAGEDHGFAWWPALVRGMDVLLQQAPAVGRPLPGPGGGG
ncbi:alpha/beta hydrolase-fold protein [Curvibacter sp. HBC61]|uniref:Alpha/beta hydrolase-fold protein n=1 Tax=Curvibacter cyanobacteriorum TaxID=3026422 RepID=A0ABT5MWF1_9BURK|nr:alpha/beta hydrolase-fold protein [Curvibacter sp. HBC61]MDD0837112.1 alpha/beta hydrolase-fold protein [Curvibacter sp. HBC61]